MASEETVALAQQSLQIRRELLGEKNQDYAPSLNSVRLV